MAGQVNGRLSANSLFHKGILQKVHGKVHIKDKLPGAKKNWNHIRNKQEVCGKLMLYLKKEYSFQNSWHPKELPSSQLPQLLYLFLRWIRRRNRNPRKSQIFYFFLILAFCPSAQASHLFLSNFLLPPLWNILPTWELMGDMTEMGKKIQRPDAWPCGDSVGGSWTHLLQIPNHLPAVHPWTKEALNLPLP